MPPVIDSKEKLLKVLEVNTVKDGTGCWLWQGGTVEGYGKTSFMQKRISVHRASAYLFLEFDLEGDKQVLHKLCCTHRNCWNPEHLYIGTPSDNVMDIMTTRTNYQTTKTHCPQGHPLDGVKSSGRRYCKTCNNIRNKRYNDDSLPILSE